MHVTLAPKSEDELEVNHHHDYYYGCIAHAPYPIFPYLNFGHYCTVFSCSVSSDTPRYPKCLRPAMPATLTTYVLLGLHDGLVAPLNT